MGPLDGAGQALPASKPVPPSKAVVSKPGTKPTPGKAGGAAGKQAKAAAAQVAKMEAVQRAKAQKEETLQDEAATKLQAIMRRRQAQKDKQIKKEAAGTVQSFIKKKLARKQGVASTSALEGDMASILA